MNKITKVFTIITVILLCITISLFSIGLWFFDTDKLFHHIIGLFFVSTAISFSVFFISWAIEVLKKIKV